MQMSKIKEERCVQVLVSMAWVVCVVWTTGILEALWVGPSWDGREASVVDMAWIPWMRKYPRTVYAGYLCTQPLACL